MPQLDQGQGAIDGTYQMRFWVVVDNQGTQPLYVDAVSYTADETQILLPPTGEEYVQYEVPAGETHGLRMEHGDTYFLRRAPDEITLTDNELVRGAWRYEVLCG